MATIYDVAKRAGVSISTVSLALNSPGRVKESTLDRVLSVADELDYTPKAEAATQARRGVARIGVLAPFTSYPSFASRLNGILRVTHNSAWEVVVYDQESAAVRSPTLASLPLSRRLDGLIIMSLPLDEVVARRLRKQRLPTVLLDTRHPDFSSVATDDGEGGRLAAEYLLQRGHTRFAFISEEKRGQHDYLRPQARLDAFRRTLRTAGLELPGTHVVHVPYTVEGARRAAHTLLDREDRPTAVFAHDDRLAAGVLRAARDRGMSVPGDLAVVGFDDDEFAELLELTTVRQPLRESGEVAAQTLLSQLADPDRTVQQITLRLSLVERSTA